MKKNILITGGAQRIGKEISIFFAKKGWNIVIHFHKSKKEATALKKKNYFYGGAVYDCEGRPVKAQ